MRNEYDHSPAGGLECSPAKPWGIHASVVKGSCARCGWVARRRAEARQEPRIARRVA